MTLYIVVLLLLLYLVYRFDIKCKVNHKHKCLRLIFIIFVLISGLRYHIGIDSIRYESTFINSIPTFRNLLYSINREFISQPLWIIFNSIIKTFTGSFLVLQLVHAVLLNFLFINYFKQTTTKVFTALLIYYCTYWCNFNFEILRESLCVAFFLNGLVCIRNNNIKKYILLAVIASGFHYFSFVPFILAPIFIYLDKRVLYPFIVALLFFMLILMDASLIESILIMFSEEIDGASSDAILSYVNNKEQYGFRSMNLNGLIQTIVLNYLYPIAIMICYPKSKYKSIIVRMILFHLLLAALQIKMVIFYRFMNYTIVIIIAATATALYNTQLKNKVKVLFKVLVFIFVFTRCIDFYKPSSAEFRNTITYDCRYIPYKTYLQKPDPIREEFYRNVL